MLPELPVYSLDDLYDEVELLGFPVRDPFQLVDDDPAKYIPAAEMKYYKGKTISLLGYHITQKPVRTIRGETMSFGTFIDSKKDWIDTVHFPEIYKMAAPQSGFFRITGKVIEEFGVYNIEVTFIEKAPLKKRTLQTI
jgi:DNA polymerase-3 subunit alpha